jgi:hypothetical protein
LNPFAIVAVVAIAILAIAEFLVARQKSLMKKEFLRELDRLDKEK